MRRLAGFSLSLFGLFTFAMGINSGQEPWMIAGAIVTVAGSLMLAALVRSRVIILGALTLAALIGFIAQFQSAEGAALAPTLMAWASWVVGWFAFGSIGTTTRVSREP